MARANRQPPQWPQPVAATPSSYWIVETIQGFALAWRDVLKSARVPELGIDTHLGDEAKADLNRRLTLIPDHQRPTLITMGRDLQPYTMWEQHRETYDVHPAMTHGLMKMKSTATVPAGLLRRLRHPNPLILLPGAPPITHADGAPGRIIAMQVTGSSSARYPQTGNRRLAADTPRNAAILADTHDPDANSYHVLLVSEVQSPDRTQITDLDYCHLTIPLDQEFTLDELVTQTAQSGFSWTRDMGELGGQNTQEAYLREAARAVVSHLLYACSRTVELDEGRNQRPATPRRPGQPKPPRPALVHRMGYRTGAAIADVLRRAQDPRPPGPGTGATKAPHVRGSHLHLYRVGPGRAEVEVKLLGPIAVNAHRDDGTTITRHPMR